MLLRSISILLFSIVLIYSCDAPRLNPLDPENPNFITHKKYSIKGIVSSAPSVPIANANVYWQNESRIVKSDQIGSFLFQDVDPINGWLYFEKDGYKNDSLFVEWTDTVFNVQKFLEAVQITSITGTVRASASPSAPITGVNVFWSGENIISKTDVSGNFKFENIEKNDGWIYFEHDLYYYDSIYVDWGSESQINVQKFLLTVPTANIFSIYTEIQNTHSAASFHIGFETEITDKDDVVDSVIIYNNELDIYISLSRLTFNKYGNKFKISELKLSSIETAVGRDFNLIFVDKQNKKFVAAKEKIARVINQEIVFIAPINGNTVSSTPRLEWNRFIPGYKFHYKIQIFTNETGGGSLVFEQDNISSENVKFDITTPIDNEVNGINSYYWVIWSIDEFNNKNRSRQASFIVE